MAELFERIQISKILRRAVCAAALVFIFTAAFVSAARAGELVLVYDGESHAYGAPPITLTVNGAELSALPMPPVVIGNRTLVPARETFEALGAAVSWNASTRETYIGYGGTLIILQIDSYVANLNGALEVMETAPKIINGKTMIPLRFASEALGLAVGWDAENRVASVSERPIIVSPPEAFPVVDAPQAGAGFPQAPSGLPRQPELPIINESMETPIDVSSEKIAEMSYPETQITGVEIPGDGVSVFTVAASSPISRVDTFPLVGNRIVVDFYNAQMASAKTAWQVDSALVDTVRMAQNQADPVSVTRVVFDLPLAATYRVDISDDRREVYVLFENNSVNDVSFYSDATGDYLEIGLGSVSAVNVSHLTKPDRIVVDIPYSTISGAFSQQVSGTFAYELRASQFEAYTARIVLDLTRKAQHTISASGATVTIKLSEPTFRNIDYDEDANVITVSKGGMAVSAESAAHYDAYDAGEYILTFPADLSPVIGYGEYPVQNDYLRSILIRNNSLGQTEIVLNERRVLVPQVSEDGGNIYIKLLLPREVYDKIVVVDPGHGGNMPGASYHGLVEKDLNLSIAQKIMELFARDGRVKAYATRTTDIDIDLSDRALFANDVGDLFVSVHNNAAEQNPEANGTEAHYYEHDFEHLLGITGKEAAEILHRRLVGYLGSNERKILRNDLAVTREATIPAVLLEIGFVSNEAEAALLATDEYRQLAAQAVFDGIMEIFEVYTPTR